MSVRSAFGARQLINGRRTKAVGENSAPLDAREHLLLARGAVEVVLARRAGVLSHPREAERLAPVQLVLAL